TLPASSRTNRSQSVFGVAHWSRTCASPLSNGAPEMVKGTSSCGPVYGLSVFSAGTPAGLTRLSAGWVGPVGLRPYRPATYGRVDGLTAQRKYPVHGLKVESSVSAYRSGSPTVPSGLRTGEVGVWNCLCTRSVYPGGAQPAMVAWSAAFAVDASISKYASRLPPLPAPAAGARPMYSATTPV